MLMSLPTSITSQMLILSTVQRINLMNNFMNLGQEQEILALRAARLEHKRSGFGQQYAETMY